MILLQRDRTAVPPIFLDPARRTRLLELYRAAHDGKLTEKAVKARLFNSGRWGAAKKQLEREANGKCAFCEAPTSATYFGDVEHFRPKSDYWWLAYCYDNYLYSCRVCNGKKSAQHLFQGVAAPEPMLAPPMADAALLALASSASPSPVDAQALAVLSAQLAAEDASLPHPYEEDAETLFIWTADPVLKEVRIAARPGLPRAARALVAVEQIVDLNREELRIWRWKTFEFLQGLQAIAVGTTGPPNPGAIALMRTMADRKNPFSAMVRYYAGEVWSLI